MFSACDAEYFIGRLRFHLEVLSEQTGGGVLASDNSLEHLLVLRVCWT